MSILTICIGIPLGLVIAVVRMYGFNTINAVIIFYIDFFRSIPQIVLIILVYFGLPYFNIVINPFWATIFALSVVLSAFSEEIFWAGINSVAKGQWEAARSTGMTFSQTLQNVILPQVIRITIPPLTNRAIGISKGTVLGSVIAVPELLNVTSSIQSNVANPTALTVGAILFVALFLPFVIFTRWLERVHTTPR